MINPTIKPLLKKKTEYWERCLSIPGLHGKVPRFSSILVKYYNLNKELIIHKAHSTWAALIQHECDHLDGVLITDQITPIRRRLMHGKLRDIKLGKMNVSIKDVNGKTEWEIL